MAVKAKVSKEKSGPETTKEERHQARVERDNLLRAEIVNLRDAEGKKWNEISDLVKVAQGKAMYLYLQEHVAPKDRLKAKSDEDMAVLIVKARDEGLLSWAQISVRSGVAEGKCHRLYEAATGESTLGNRIGKGGRYPEGDGAPKPPKRASDPRGNAVKKAAAKKAPAKKATPAGESPLFKMDEAALTDHLVGKTISFKLDGSPKRASVASAVVVGTGPDALVTITSAKGGEVTLQASDITKVS